MTYKKPDELKRWVVECIPEGLGPLLMTLISRQAITEVVGGAAEDLMKTIGLDQTANASGEDDNKADEAYRPRNAPLYQQQALERILGWIVEQAGTNPEKIAAAQWQFDNACSRMNKFGSYEYKGQVYCDNRDQMDKFMKEITNSDGANTPRNTAMRDRYKGHVKLLGALRDGYCKPSDFSGTTYLPGGRKVYTGPGV